MKRFILSLVVLMMTTLMSANDPVLVPADSTINLNEVSIVSLYRNNVNTGYLIKTDELRETNYGQEPSWTFVKMPNIYAFGDNGTQFGYGYFRIRGLDQQRINVTLDGMPWNEAEDYGTYFANSPDIMSSLHSIKVERGSSATSIGTSSSGGSINMESVNLLEDTLSYAYIGGGSFNSYKTSIVYNSGLFNKHHAIHIKATQQQTDGFKDWSSNNSQAFTLKYGWFINDSTRLEFLSMNGRHRNGQGWIGSTKEELKHNKHANGNTQFENDEWKQSVNKIQYSASKENLYYTASAYLQYQTGWYNMDLDNYMRKFEDPAWEDINVLYSYGLTHYLYGGNFSFKKYLDNFTLSGGANMFGYDRKHFMNDKECRNVSIEEYYSNTGHKTDFSAFLDLKYSLQKFSFNVNIQYRYVDFTYKDHLNKDIRYSKNEMGTEWNFVNFSLGVEYALYRTSKLYARFVQTNREPTRSDMFGGAEMFAGEITTNKAERSQDVEAGYEVAKDKIKANINFYYMNFSNERVLSGEFGLNGLPLHITANESYRTGIETYVEWNFAKNLYVTSAMSLSRNKIKTDKIYSHILTPSFTFNNEVYYKKDNFKIGLSNTYRSSLYVDSENTYKIPEYLTINVNATYRIKNIELGARVNNIFNKCNYYSAALDINGDILWFREAGTNAFVDCKIYF